MADNIRNQALALAQKYGTSAPPFDLGASLQGQFGAPPPQPAPAAAIPPAGFDMTAALQNEFGTPSAPKEEVWNAGLGSGPVRVMGAAPAVVPQRPGAMAMTPANDVEPPPPAAPPAAASPAPQAARVMPAGPVMVSPGGWRDASRTTRTEVGSPESIQAIDTSLEFQREANLADIEIAKQRGEAHAAYTNAVADANKRHAEQSQALELKRQQYVAGQMDKLQSLAAETNAKVDPDAIWKERGTGAQVAAAIAIGLGQFAAVMSKTENTAAKMIDRAIERNIRAQEANIANKRAEYDVQNNLLARNIAEFGDKEKALLATRMQMYDAAKAQLDAQVAKLGTPEAEANGKKTEAELYSRYAAARNQFRDKSTVESHTVNEPAKWASVGGTGKDEKAENIVTLADGTSVQFQNKDQANKAVERVQAYTQLQQMDKRALGLREQLKTLSPGSAQYEAVHAELQQMAVDRIYTDSTSRGQGVVKEDEMKRGLELSPYLRGIGSSGTIMGHASKLWTLDRDYAAGNNMIRAATERADQDQRALVKAAGGTIVERGFAIDARGNKVPIAQQTGQFVAPDEVLAPKGFKPYDPRLRVPTREATLKDQTPAAPVRGGTGGR